MTWTLITLAAVLAVYLVLARWVLPRFGIET